MGMEMEMEMEIEFEEGRNGGIYEGANGHSHRSSGRSAVKVLNILVTSTDYSR